MKQTGPARTSVTCVLPGLVWPAAGITAIIPATRLPALSALVGRGSSRQSAAIRYMEWLGRSFGVGENLPWATFRRAGETGLPTLGAGETCLCADPVSLAFTRDSLLLGSPDSLALSMEDSNALVAYLNEQFGDIGIFEAATPTRWYLRTRAAIGTRFHALPDVIGRPVAYFQPEGENATFWTRTLNELQVALYNHPINQARQERNHPTANGLWLWGTCETLPAHLSRPADAVISDDPLIRGLARMASVFTQTASAAGSPAHGKAGHTWWHDDSLASAATAGDIDAWAAALLRIEENWLQPLWEAWRAGKLHALRIVAPCDKTLLQIEISARSKWQFWRKPATAAALATLLQTPQTQQNIPKPPAP